MTELAENPQDSFDPRLDAPVFGAVNLGGDTDSTAARLAAMPAQNPAVRSGQEITIPETVVRR